MALDNDEIAKIVQTESDNALNYLESNYQEERIKATEYYNGELDLPAEEGRSTVTSRDVSDVIDQIMPALMRIFSSSDYVKYAPRSREDEAAADQASDLANYVVNVENGGFRLFHDWFKSALLYKVGVVRVSWDDLEQVEEKSYEGLTQLELNALLADDTVEIVEQKAEIITEAQLDETGMEMLPAVQSYDATIKRRVRRGKVNLDLIPPEEFLIDTRAKSVDDARFVAHRTETTISDLVAMGYDQDELEEYVSYRDMQYEQEKQVRFRDLDAGYRDDPADESQRNLIYQESFIRIDADEDGIAETMRVCTVGDDYHVLKAEITDPMPPFAMLSPILMPHRAIGQSIAEKLFDIARVKSALIRQTVDNVFLSNNARVVAVEGATNLSDLMTSRPGGIVRVRQAGAVQPLNVPPVGREALAMLNYIDQVKESRTGVSKAAQGLDPDALQSTTAAAVQATVNAAAAHIELIARVFAETGVSDLFKLILRMITQYQDQPKTIRIRNQFIEMDPRGWNPEMDVQVNVGLGTGQTQEKMVFLGQVASKQEQILQTLGPNNPLVSLPQYANTLQKMIEMAGFKDTRSFVNPPSQVAQMAQQMAAQAAQSGGQPDKEMQRLEAEAELKRMEIEAKAVQSEKEAVQRAELEQRKAEQQAEIERFKIELNAEAERQRQLNQMTLDRERMDREFQLKIAELEAEKELEAVKMAAGSRDGQGNINLSD